jgi:hypothetical protein
MTKEQRSTAINLSFDGMMTSQAIIDCSLNPHDRNIAEALYNSFWCLYQILTEDRRKPND